MTKAELRKLVLKHLTIIDTSEDPSAEDALDMDIWIDSVRSELLERGRCWWGADAIPASVVPALTLILAARSCRTFGKAGQGHEGGDADGTRLLNSLRSTEERPTVQTEFF